MFIDKFTDEELALIGQYWHIFGAAFKRKLLESVG